MAKNGTIVVIGATGVAGRNTTKQLLDAGYKVRAVTRHLENAQDLEKLGAELVQADLVDKKSLAAACQGAWAVIAAAHSFMGRGKYRSKKVDFQGHKDLIDAAKDAGAKHFVYLSMLGVNAESPVDFVRSKALVEEHLKQSGLDYTIFRPGAFMEWHAHEYIGKGIVTKNHVTLFGRGESPINFISGTDVARFIVKSLKDPKLRNTTLEIGGPKNFTRNEVVDLYSKALKTSPKVKHVSVGQLKFMSKLIGPFHQGLGRAMKFSILEDQYGMPFDSAKLRKQYPFPYTTMETFVKSQVPKPGSN